MSRFVHIIAVSTLAIVAYDVSVWIAAPRSTTESALSTMPILIDGSSMAYGKQASSMRLARDAGSAANPQTSSQVVDLEAALEETKRNSTTQIQALQAQLSSEQAKTTSLDDHLALARERLAEADRAKSAQTVAKDKVAELQDRQQQAVAAALNEAKRSATVQLEAVQTQLANEQAKTSSLDGDLAQAREQLARADGDKAALEAAANDKEAKLQAQQQPLAAALDETRRSATAQIQALQSQLASVQAKTTSLDNDLAQAREQLAQADQDRAAQAATVKIKEAELQAKQQPLAVALDEATRSATAQIQSLESQLASDWPRYRLDEAEADRIARAFFAASRDRDNALLTSLLASDVEIRSDGDDAYPNMVRGIDRVMRLFAGLAGKPSFQRILLQTATVDGLPGYVTIDRDGALQTTALDIRDGKIAAVYIVCTPDKLRQVAMTVGQKTASAN